MRNKLKYLVFNKPYQMLSQFTKAEGKKSLDDAGIVYDDVYPIGRLDYDSEGLLILSNDKYLIHSFTSHNPNHKRTYLAQVEGIFSELAVQLLSNGVDINVNGKLYRTKPCKIERILEPAEIPERVPPIRFRKNVPDSWIKITLSEGKNRQVRKMTAKAAFPTLRLIRIAIENLTLDNIKTGEYVEVDKNYIYRKLKYK